MNRANGEGRDGRQGEHAGKADQRDCPEHGLLLEAQSKPPSLNRDAEGPDNPGCLSSGHDILVSAVSPSLDFVGGSSRAIALQQSGATE
jgi:hypothetical protein